MKKRTFKKLQISRETLYELPKERLEGVAGAASIGDRKGCQISIDGTCSCYTCG